MLTSSEPVYFQSGIELQKQLRAARIDVQKEPSFEPGDFKNSTLEEIKLKSLRIVMVMACSDDLRQISGKASQIGMDTAGWAFITTLALVQASTDFCGWLVIQPHFDADKLHGFAENVSLYGRSGFNVNVPADSVDLPYATALFEAIMLYAHATTKVLAEGGDIFNGTVVTEAVRNTSIVGLGNRVVELDKQGDRVQSYIVTNYVLGQDDVMRSLAVGVYNQSHQEYTALDRLVIWPGNRTEIPADFAAKRTKRGEWWGDNASHSHFLECKAKIKMCTDCEKISACTGGSGADVPWVSGCADLMTDSRGPLVSGRMCHKCAGHGQGKLCLQCNDTIGKSFLLRVMFAIFFVCFFFVMIDKLFRTLPSLSLAYPGNPHTHTHTKPT